MCREAFIAVHNSVSKDSEIKKKKTYTLFKDKTLFKLLNTIPFLKDFCYMITGNIE